ncbi:hypothetical protein [Mycobacteroides abscessus]|uniref:hypothetical protein n=1 Tax=Mycobacteroides abscessus TaxID=36809 RepID=UPI000925F3B6|nr:hypothetical protein [Mycobacteroides abscessus]SHX64667.1 Uncharacterised protein [Mycobacteroides abscessus subsp. abscessus]SHZ18291.1 Uncharacterised protein [Mycobacteroides abscessus subsp. abscessus]SIB50909.1 Uncharacterised protein [Mycobacteroides abscessus subsp. abscessus]SIF18768.1 Uncharacterised protein [Mycobacteroides abscessus subsp. abscessus]SKI48335.1 Uncharacterised protein [Mycobacteroides abscessus subsp. abscessus]
MNTSAIAPGTRSVYGIDVTVSAVSVVRIAESDPVLKAAAVLVTSDAGAVHTVASTLQKLTAAADSVTAAVLARGVPSVVVMSKGLWNDMRADPSASRRLALWWFIADRLRSEGAPIAEFPLPTLTTWARGGSGKSTGKMLEHQGLLAKELWPAVGELAAPFRPGTALLAAAGAMAVGIGTPVAPTQERLNILRGYDSPEATQRSNKAIQWPAHRKPPRTVEGWNRLHAEGLSAVAETDELSVAS